MKSLTPKELKEILVKCWMTHDGMWFYHCLKECGIEKTNRVNKAAIRSLAAIEVKRITKALEIEEVKTFDRFKAFLEGVYGVVKGDFMKFTYGFPAENHFHMEMQQCFAYEGIKQMGVIDQYQCGILHRVESWFDVMGIRYSVVPKVEGCMMHTEGNCYRDYEFTF